MQFRDCRDMSGEYAQMQSCPFISQGSFIFLFLFHVCHQLSLELDLGFLFLKLSSAFIVELVFKLLLHASFLFLSLLALLADFFLIFLSLEVDDLDPFILWKHGGAIDTQVNQFFTLGLWVGRSKEKVHLPIICSCVALHRVEMHPGLPGSVLRTRLNKAIIKYELFRCLFNLCTANPQL